jgi:hypothetical protein
MRFSLICGAILAIAGRALCDVDYMSVRTKLATDFRGKGAEPGEKYFRMLTPTGPSFQLSCFWK